MTSAGHGFGGSGSPFLLASLACHLCGIVNHTYNIEEITTPMPSYYYTCKATFTHHG